MATNLPATQGGDGGITHKAWMTDMGSAVKIMATLIHELALMREALGKVQAGRTQRTLVTRDLSVGIGLRDQTVPWIGETHERYAPIGEAVAHAGGVDEVALEKRYHTVG
jgi:hypothetical protein